MSLKSFDKFCERIILNEPESQKEIFDERQKIMQNKLATEALFIYVVASMLCCMSVEFIYKWTESCCFTLLALGAVCAVYYQIRCSAKGCLIGVNGLTAKKYSGWTMIIGGTANMIRYAIGALGSDDGAFFVRDGMLTADFMVSLTFAAILIWGIIITVKMNRLWKMEAKG